MTNTQQITWSEDVYTRQDIYECFEKNTGLIIQIATAQVGNFMSHDEIISDFYIYMFDDAHARWKKFDPTRGAGRMVNFLAWAARSRYSSVLRQHMRHNRRCQYVDTQSFDLVQSCTANAISQALVDSDEFQRFRRRLSDTNRLTIDTLCSTNGNRTEAASVLGIPIGTLNSRIGKCRRVARRYKLVS